MLKYSKFINETTNCLNLTNTAFMVETHYTWLSLGRMTLRTMEVGWSKVAMWPCNMIFQKKVFNCFHVNHSGFVLEIGDMHDINNF